MQRLPDKLDGNISLNALCFSHTAETEIFNNVNLYIPSGTKVGIVGQTGIGKSTLLDLLQCHLLPNSGSIRIDGINIANIDRQNWRKRIAIAPQEPVIFRDSLANNIRYGYPQASNVEVYRAAISAGLAELIGKMPHGIGLMHHSQCSQAF